MRSLDDMPPMEPGSTAHFCPLDDCDWMHVEPPPTDLSALVAFLGFARRENAGPSALAFGLRDWALADARRGETALAAHFNSHTPEDFLRTIMRLRTAVLNGGSA